MHSSTEPRRTVGESASRDRKSTRLNSSHANISYAVFCLKDTAPTEISTLSLHDALPIPERVPPGAGSSPAGQRCHDRCHGVQVAPQVEVAETELLTTPHEQVDALLDRAPEDSGPVGEH